MRVWSSHKATKSSKKWRPDFAIITITFLWIKLIPNFESSSMFNTRGFDGLLGIMNVISSFDIFQPDYIERKCLHVDNYSHTLYLLLKGIPIP